MIRTKIEQEEAAETLRGLIKPGDTVYTSVSHVSRSGMMRVIDAFTMQNNEPRNISGLVALATTYTYNEKHQGVRVDGCGMDMGFALVYSLSHALYPSYKCVGQGKLGVRRSLCPSNEHVNPGPDRDNFNRNRKHSDGYAINQSWM